MNTQNLDKETSLDIPKQIFGKFLEELKTTEIPKETIKRLQDLILKEETPNETDIKTALFSDIQNI